MPRKSKRTVPLKVVNPLWGAGPVVRRLHAGPEGDGGLAQVVRGEEGGDGIDLGVLDPGVRGAGACPLRGCCWCRRG